MQTQTNDKKTPVHIKAQHNDEFRRFSLHDLTFASLDSMLRTLFNITSDIKVKFLDDEKDWILISSDSELQHAVEISTSPIRIQVTLPLVGKAPVASVPLNTQTKVGAAPEGSEEQFSCQKRGCRRGMGRGGCGKGPMLSDEERVALKTARITGRISAFETALLEPSLPSDRARAITWRLEHLKSKLEKIKSAPQGEGLQEFGRPWRRGPGGPCCELDMGHVQRTTESDVPCGDAPAWGHCGKGRGGRCARARFDVQRTTESDVPCGDAPAWGHCGKGRGGRCARARFDGQKATESEGDHMCGKKWVVPKETWAHFHECKENLQVARRSGDAEAIKVAFEAFLLAKKEKKEARYSKA